MPLSADDISASHRIGIPAMCVARNNAQSRNRNWKECVFSACLPKDCDLAQVNWRPGYDPFFSQLSTWSDDRPELFLRQDKEPE